MRCKIAFCIAAVFLLCCASKAKAQNFAIKSNLIYDATATVNLGMEVGLAPQWTLDLSGNFNAWSKNEDVKWKHWMFQPEAKYWFCDRFSRHFVGVHLIGGAYNFASIDKYFPFLKTDLSSLSDMRYQGYAYGCGASYGFAFVLSKHLNLELEAGFGYMYLDYETFKCTGCGQKIRESAYHYVGPTKAAINIVYVF